jgi:exodeoxyribonuclease VII small subunit
MGKTDIKKSFEIQLKELEAIVEILDRCEAPLEELLNKYEEGMELARCCREFLDKAELKIIEIGKQLKD